MILLKMKRLMTKKIFMIAGPNGAGKTTTAYSFIKDNMVDEFINADEIARGLAPLHPESMSVTASKLFIKRFHELIEARQNFAFETTGAARNYIKHLRNAQELGFEINLFFLWLPSANLAVERVAYRVKQGGHHIPEDTVRNRYSSGLNNLIKHYLPLADNAWILDNSCADTEKVIARKIVDQGLKIEEPNIWKEIQEVSRVG